MNFKENIILENDKVRLSPISMVHLEELLPIPLATPNLLQYSPTAFGTREALADYIEQSIQAREDQNRYCFVIFDKANQRFIGASSFARISTYHRKLEIGWTWIDKASQGTGINMDCKFLLLSYAFENLQFERVELKTDSRNLQSQKAIKKIGATYEGKLRSDTLMLDGHRRDSVYFSILKQEWADIKKNIFSKYIKD